MEPDVLHLLDYEESDIMMVRKFNIELDLKYFDKEEIDPDPGLGVFQIVKGKFSIPFKFDRDIISIPWKEMTNEQISVEKICRDTNCISVR